MRNGVPPYRDAGLLDRSLSIPSPPIRSIRQPYAQSGRGTVVPSYLYKAQAEPSGKEARYFIDMDEARDWLFDDSSGDSPIPAQLGPAVTRSGPISQQATSLRLRVAPPRRAI